MPPLALRAATRLALAWLAWALAACSLFGGGNDADPPAYEPPEAIFFQVALSVSHRDNPRAERFALDITVGDSVSPSNLISSFDTLALVTWHDLPGDQPATVRVKGYSGNRWVTGTTWAGYLPRRNDTTVRLVLHPVYDGFYSPLDTVPRLQDLQRSVMRFTFNREGPPALGLSLTSAALFDSAQAARCPDCVQAVLWGDSLYAMDSLGHFGVTSYPDSGATTCRFVPLALNERAAYQRILALDSLRPLWNADSARAKASAATGRWLLAREEDNAYLLHIVSRDSLTGAAEWEFYRARHD